MTVQYDNGVFSTEEETISTVEARGGGYSVRMCHTISTEEAHGQYGRGYSASRLWFATVKVIRFDLLAPVITTALLLPVEWKIVDFIGNDEYSVLICRKLISTFMKAVRNNDSDKF